MQFVYGYVKVSLKDISEYSNKRISASILTSNNYVSVENLLSNKRGRKDAEIIPQESNLIQFISNDILIGNIRPYLKKIWFSDRMGGTNGDVLIVRIKDFLSEIVVPRYLYHCLASDNFFHYNNSFAKGAKMPRGDKTAIMDYEFDLPSVEVQQYIADILDRFDKLCNDLSEGLPAEIEARKKQYEYYRDKLLTFKELA